MRQLVFPQRPSLNNERRTDKGRSPYLLMEGTLDECIKEVVAKPAHKRHLYENPCIAHNLRLISRVLSGEAVVELARRRDRSLPHRHRLQRC